MIKRLKPLIILLAVTLVLAVTLWVLVAFVLPKDEAGAEKGNSVTLLDLNLTEAESVQIKNTFDDYTLIKQAIGTYYVDGKKGYSVNGDSVVGMLEDIGSLVATKKVIENPSDEQMEGYGLKNPTGTVKIVNKGETIQLNIGTTSATGNYYCKLVGDPAVYLIDTTVPDRVLLARYQFYVDTMIDYTGETAEMETFNNIYIGGTKRPEKLKLIMQQLGEEEVGTTFLMTEPFTHSFNSVYEESITNLLSALSSSAVVGDDTSPEGLKKVGLDRPVYTFQYNLKGETVEVHFGNTTEAGYQYCYTVGGKFVHSVEATNTGFLGLPLKDLCEDMIYGRAADALSAIKVTGQGKNYYIDIGEKDNVGDFFVTINNKQVNSEHFSDFYSHILTIAITDMGDKPAGVAPRLAVEFTLKNGTTEVVNFYPVSELKCFVELNGAGRFYVSTMNVDRILDNAQKLYNGEVIQTEW